MLTQGPVDDAVMLGVDVLAPPAPAPVPTAPGRTARSLGRTVAIAVLASVIAAAAGGTFVSASQTQSWFPKTWDPRIAPIAAEVAKLRGLDFVHPVAVHYLSASAFEKQLGSNADASSAAKAETAREEAVFRALGFFGGKDDLAKAAQTDQTSGTLAYYDPVAKQIFVRGTTLDVSHRVTIAHELTHVLQDQHFDLVKLEKRAEASKSGDRSALRALVEGDAVRIEDDYTNQLSTADQQENDRENASEGQRVGKETSSVPDIVSLLFGAPYEFGPSTIRVLLESGGNDIVNQALTGPTPSSEVFVETGDVDPPVAVTAPLPSPDGTLVGDPETFGPFELYLTLAQRIDAGRALLAADLVAGGEAVTFRSNAILCYRVALAPLDASARGPLLDAVRAWAAGRARTAIDDSGDLVQFTVCDPGRTAPEPSSPRFHNLEFLLGFRSSFTVDAAKGHQTGAFARCVSREFLALPGGEALVLAIGNNQPTASQIAKLRDLGAQSGANCRDDTTSGLP